MSDAREIGGAVGTGLRQFNIERLVSWSGLACEKWDGAHGVIALPWAPAGAVDVGEEAGVAEAGGLLRGFFFASRLPRRDRGGKAHGRNRTVRFGTSLKGPFAVGSGSTLML